MASISDKTKRPKKKKTNQGGRPAGKQNYTRFETINLLEIMEDVVPICGEEWRIVEA